MPGQDGGLDVHRLVVVAAASEEHALGLELPTAARFAGRRRNGFVHRFTRAAFRHAVGGGGFFHRFRFAFLIHVIVFSGDLRRLVCERGQCLGLRRVGFGRLRLLRRLSVVQGRCVVGWFGRRLCWSLAEAKQVVVEQVEDA